MGPRRRSDVRLRSFISLRYVTDSVHSTTAEHQPRRVGRPGRGGQSSYRHRGRQRAEHDPASVFLGTQCAAELPATSAATSAQAGDPLGTLSDLISIFLDAPSAIATFAADIPFGVIGVVALPLDIIGAGTGLHTDKIVSGWDGEEPWPDDGDQPPTAFPARITGPIGPSRRDGTIGGPG